jgi:hypothetical protein
MNDKLWRTKNALKPSGANIGVKGRFGRNISEYVSVSANRVLKSNLTRLTSRKELNIISVSVRTKT